MSPLLLLLIYGAIPAALVIIARAGDDVARRHRERDGYGKEQP